MRKVSFERHSKDEREDEPSGMLNVVSSDALQVTSRRPRWFEKTEPYHHLYRTNGKHGQRRFEDGEEGKADVLERREVAGEVSEGRRLGGFRDEGEGGLGRRGGKESVQVASTKAVGRRTML
jgi:hypothetical protein